MCQICENNYNHEVLDGLKIDNCCILTEIGDEFIEDLVIYNCPNLMKIINTSVMRLVINSCNIINIDNVQQLTCLLLQNCFNITNLPQFEHLTTLAIDNCPNIVNIQKYEYLQYLRIVNNNKYYDYDSELLYDEDDGYDEDNTEVYDMKKIKEFYNINKIKTWYKKRKLYNKYIFCINQIQELIVMDQINPRKENNTYLENILNDYVYID